MAICCCPASSARTRPVFLQAALRDHRTQDPSGLGKAVRDAFPTLPGKFRQLHDAGLQLGVCSDLLHYRGKIEDGPLTVDRRRVVAKGGVVFVDDGKWIESSH